MLDAVDGADLADKVQKVGHCERAGLARRQFGLPVQAFLPKVGLVIAMHEADEDFGQKRGADGSETLTTAADLGLLENIVPKRRLQMQAVGLSDRTIWSGGDLRRRQRVCDMHCPCDILPGRQPQDHAPAQIPECEIATPAR